MSEEEIIAMLEHILIEMKIANIENIKDCDDFYAAGLWSEALRIFEDGGLIK